MECFGCFSFQRWMIGNVPSDWSIVLLLSMSQTVIQLKAVIFTTATQYYHCFHGFELRMRCPWLNRPTPWLRLTAWFSQAPRALVCSGISLSLLFPKAVQTNSKSVWMSKSTSKWNTLLLQWFPPYLTPFQSSPEINQLASWPSMNWLCWSATRSWTWRVRMR